MPYILYFSAAVILISLQTAFFSELPAAVSFYDILIPFAVYLSLFRGLTTGLSLVIISGFIMDMLSGAPNGLYMAVFTAVFLVFRKASVYFHTRLSILFTVCTGLGALIENLAFFLCCLAVYKTLPACLENLRVLPSQIIWVCLTGPFVYRLFDVFFSRASNISISK